jgi:hypothetical protein
LLNGLQDYFLYSADIRALMQKENLKSIDLFRYLQGSKLFCTICAEVPIEDDMDEEESNENLFPNSFFTKSIGKWRELQLLVFYGDITFNLLHKYFGNFDQKQLELELKVGCLLALLTTLDIIHET